MKIIKKGLLAGMALCCMPLLTACSFKETLGILWNSEDRKAGEETDSEKNSLTAANIDDSVEKPTLSGEMGDPVTYGLNGKAEALLVEASVSDGGTLSYQWYRNNVDSNGGGTEIEGAVEKSFTPPTSEPGTSYYYAVVTNTVGKGIQLTASATKCVTVTEEPAATGTWEKDGKGWWYKFEDGTYPKSKWEKIEGEWYAFDENGYMRTGWFKEGDKWYYLNDNGSMAHDTDVDGYHLGSNGVME